jgi:uncharacterized protein YacL
MEIILFIAILNFACTLVVLWYITPTRLANNQHVVLDTSAIMDGRIIEVVKSGFIPPVLIIPRFVIAELQLLADKADHLKRERARYGLRMIQQLQDSRNIVVKISDVDFKGITEVDKKLILLSKKLHASLFSTDYNLLKVAEIEGIGVLNINELAQNLRPITIPGESVVVKIVSKGQEKSQGIGYLDDGTMVVVDNASKYIGKKISVEVTRSLLTVSGRMMFAKILKHNTSERKQSNRHHQKSQNIKPMSLEEKLLKSIEENA